MKTNIYLSGACKNVSIQERDNWRNHIYNELNYMSSNFYVFNPNTHFSYDKNNPNNERVVMDYFLKKVEECDVLVVNLNNSASSVGTGMEVDRALAANKFIIGFGDENVYPYIKEKCSIIFDDVDDLIEFLILHFND